MSNKFLKSERGVAAVETGIILLVFIFMIFGIIEFARVFWTQTTLDFATEEAARYAIVNDPSVVSDATVLARASSKASTISPAPTFTIVGVRTAKDVTVQGTYTFTFLVIPLANITLTSKSHYSL